MDGNGNESLGNRIAEQELAEDLSPEDREAIYVRAVRTARIRLSLYIHAAVFAFVMLILVVVNLAASPGVLWVVWPFAGWGVGLLLHWFLATRLVQMYDAIKEREIARELELRQRR